MTVQYKQIIVLFSLALTLTACGQSSLNTNVKQFGIKEVAPRKQIPDKITVPQITAADHVKGSDDAAVTIIVYSDFECTFCAQFSGIDGSLAKATNEFGNKLRLVFRHYTLAFDAQAMKAAEASECAAEQGKFWEMHDKLFADNINSQFNPVQFKQNAMDLGLNKQEFDTCLDTNQYYDKVIEAVNNAEDIGIRSAPHFFVNGRSFVGALSYNDYVSDYGKEEGLQTIIHQELDKLHSL